MTVMLSAAACLEWVARLTGFTTVEDALAAAVPAVLRREVFLPYLSGERSPYDDPLALGVFFGLSMDTDRARLVRAVLEGVAFGLAQGQEVLERTGSPIVDVSVIGGGARSLLWCGLLASALGRPVFLRPGGELGPALGAARLARLGVTGETIERGCTAAPAESVSEPAPELVEAMRPRRALFDSLYPSRREEFHRASSPPQGPRP